jgi:chlorite dismutase
MKKINPFKEISINKNYNTFFQFFEENREIIFKEIYEIFKEFKNTRKRKLILSVKTRILNYDWQTNFVFKKKEAYILKVILLPFYESIENYEMCSEIISLVNELSPVSVSKHS